MNYKLVFGAFLALRVLMAVISRSWHVPDETWQSVEVAHKLVFGQGYLTWEWQQKVAIRSFVHPILYVPGLYLLKIAQVDSPLMVEVIPRLTQGLISAVGDLCILCFFARHFPGQQLRVFILLYASNWFLNYCMSRTLINSIETVLTSAAIMLYPFKADRRLLQSLYVLPVSLSFMVRPTTAIFWTPLALRHLWLLCIQVPSKQLIYVLTQLILVGLSMVLVIILLDSWCYGCLVIVPWNFFSLNIMSNIGSFYGTHPYHWYFSNALPTALSVAFPVVMYSFLDREEPVKSLLTKCLLWTLLVYSSIPHKELRFILPIIPICLSLVANQVSSWRKVQMKKCFLIMWLLVNIPLTLYLSLVHQTGNMTAIRHLSQISFDNPEESFLFLMPCHSTPWQSHLHSSAKARFLTCEPNLRRPSIGDIDPYVDEAEQFYEEPVKWLENEYKTLLPTRIILYDSLLPKIQSFLSKNNFELCEDFFHAHITEGRVGRRVNILCRSSTQDLE